MRILVIFLLITSCVSTATVSVDIDSITSKSSESFNKVFLYPGSKNIKTDDLQFQEYSSIIEENMKQHGYTFVDTLREADLVVLVYYGIGSGTQITSNRSIPVYGNNETKTTVRNSYGQVLGSYETNQSNPYTPSSYRTVTRTHTEYPRWIHLYAYNRRLLDLKRTKEEWVTKISSTGGSNDLRKIFPYMISGAAEYIGKNTRGKVTEELQWVDE